MDWANEPWVKVYTRDTADMMAIGPEGRALWWELLRKVDRAGVVDIDGDPSVLPELLRIPWEWYEVGFPKILKRKMALMRGGKVIIPSHVDAQETRQSDRQRQRESRSRRREKALAAPQLEAAPCDSTEHKRTPSEQSNLEPELFDDAQNVTKRDAGERKPVADVTFCHDKNRTDQNRTEESSTHVRSGAEPVRSGRGFDFEGLYKLYPKKQGKKRGLETAARHIVTQAQFDAAWAAVESMAKGWEGQNKKFCPMFSTFVNQERWKEDLPMPNKTDEQDVRFGSVPAGNYEDYPEPGQAKDF